MKGLLKFLEQDPSPFPGAEDRKAEFLANIDEKYGKTSRQ